MAMWVKAGSNQAFRSVNESTAARSTAAVGPGWVLSISDSGFWSAYGDYQSNSLHRYLVVRQGTIDDAMARDYISDPAAFLAGCGDSP